MEITDDDVLRHQAWLAQQINNNRTGERTTCDLTLVSEEHEFQVHKAVMMVVSKYFEKMFTIEMKEKYSDRVEIKQIPHKRLENIIEFIYCGSIHITEENVRNVMDDAEYLEIQALKTACMTFYLKVVSAENVLRFREDAKRYSLSDVQAKMNEVIAQKFTKVTQRGDFLQLDFDNVTDVIKQRTTKCDESEAAAFTGIVAWVKYDLCQREKLFTNLFSNLDLITIAPEFLGKVYKESLVNDSLLCVNILVETMFTRHYPASLGDFVVIGGEGTDSVCAVYSIAKGNPIYLPKLNTSRIGATSVRCEYRIFVIGGSKTPDDKNLISSCEMFDLTDQKQWNTMASMSKARKYCGSAYLDGYIYVTGGFNGKSLLTCEKFDVNHNKWMKVQDMVHKRYGHGCVMCNGYIYCIGGYDDNEDLKSCERYDLKEEKWNEIASLNVARCYLASIVLDGMIYAIGGIGADDLCSVERYQPKTNKWENIASLQTARYHLSACVVESKILAI
uniref:Kelch-like protein 20 n=1 Tax=Phallusia mammillata TaxID=59560 RepID=A0A6F9DFB1_9ASCI|nr:kelch-like protein 20 [Phallusia mammillata]